MPNILSRTQKIKNWSKKHKFYTSIIFILIIAVGYFAYTKSTASVGTVEYVFGKVKKGDVVSTVGGTGQVSASSQLDIKSKVSGDIAKIYVKTGDLVKAGDPIMDIDAHDALISLQNARISMAKLTQPADNVSRLQTENALADAVQSYKESNDSLAKSYDDGFSTMANTFLDLPDIISGLKNLFYGKSGFLNVGTDVSDQARTYIRDASVPFDAVEVKYDEVYLKYKNTSRTSATSTIENLISTSYELVKEIADVTKLTKNAIDYLKDHDKNPNDSAAITAQTNISSWTSKVNTHLLDLLSVTNDIDNAKTGIVSSKRNVEEKNEALTKLVKGADPLDVQSARLDLQEKEYAYRNYFIKAPFDGVVAKLSVRSTDSVSSGAVLGTIVGSQMMASISLNEVDVLKVKPGQKARITFDAIDGLVVMGSISEVDLVGTVTQGVVSYGVNISFDKTDERIRSGMSVSVNIVTDDKRDVLVVPNGAIKNRGNKSFVEVKDMENSSKSSTTLKQVAVVPGVSNDVVTEVVSGLSEGDEIVVRSTTSAAARTSTAPSIFGNIGNRGAGSSGARTNNGAGASANR